MKFRVEEDSLGKVKVPNNAYYGAHTVRAMHHFKINVKFQPHFIKSYALVKQAAAKANIKTGRLDRKKGSAILRACKEIASGRFLDQFPLSVFQQGAGTATNMNLNEVIANRAIQLLGGKKGNYELINPNDHVNTSQSTNDTFHTTMHVAAATLIRKELLPALHSLEKSFQRKTKQFSRIIKSGRTHLQDAVPLTLGNEFSGYAAAVSENTERLEKSVEDLLEVNLGGTAVGTGINAEPKYQKYALQELSRLSKIKFKPAKNMFAATANMNAVVETSGVLRELAISLIKISSDLRLLSSGPATGLGEIKLPAVAAGSSIMPGKINPSIPEMVGMVCFEVIGNDTTIANAAESGQLELNVFMPVVAYNLLYSIEILAEACKTLDEKCVRGIKANEKRIREYLERNPVIVTALTPYIGYKKAAEIAKKSYESGKSIREICLEMKLFKEKELNKILDPKKLVKSRK